MELTETQYPIRLSEFERSLLIKKLKESKKYLEFGSGGSTFLAILEGSCDKIVSVESDPKWIEYLKTFDTINEAKNLGFESVDIGKVGDWGTPIEEDKRELFPNYSSNVFRDYPCDYDLVSLCTTIMTDRNIIAFLIFLISFIQLIQWPFSKLRTQLIRMNCIDIMKNINTIINNNVNKLAIIVNMI